MTDLFKAYLDVISEDLQAAGYLKPATQGISDAPAAQPAAETLIGVRLKFITLLASKQKALPACFLMLFTLSISVYLTIRPGKASAPPKEFISEPFFSDVNAENGKFQQEKLVLRSAKFED